MKSRFIPPAVLLLSILSLWILEVFGVLPSVNSLVDTVSSWISQRGYIAVAGVALLENLVGFGSYFPGSIPLLGVMATTAGRPSDALATFLSIYSGQVSGLVISYCLGFVGFGRAVRASHLEGSAPSRIAGLVLLFGHPHSAAATAYLLGSKRFGFEAIVLIVSACFVWSGFWAALMYFGLGPIFREIGWDYLGVGFAIGWIGFEYASYLKHRRSKSPRSTDH